MTNSTFTPEQNQDGPGQIHVYEKATMATVLIAVSLAGVIGNTLTFVVFVQNKGLRTTANILIVNLAIADILQSLNMVFMIVSLFSNGWIFGYNLCQLCGWSNIAFIVTSLFSLSLISVNRYFSVVKASQRHFFTVRSTIIMAALTWALASLIALGPVVGWSVYEYRPGKLMCTLQFSRSYSFTVTLMLLAIGLPFSTICFCTYKIIKHIKENNTRVATSTAMAKRKRKEENRISLMLLSVIFGFMIFYTPASVLNFVQMGYGNTYRLPFRLDAWSVLLAMFNHANNPIIYCILNSNFRKCFGAVCSAKKRRQNRSAFESPTDTGRRTVPETA